MAIVMCAPPSQIAITIMIRPDARTVDEVVTELGVERTQMLRGEDGDVKRSAKQHRRAYTNKGGSGTNYWEDVVLEIDGRVFVCQSGSLGPDGTREIAKLGGDLCATLSALK